VFAGVLVMSGCRQEQASNSNSESGTGLNQVTIAVPGMS
jgi:hypothetical protein